MVKDGQKTVEHDSAAEFLPPSAPPPPTPPQEKTNKHTSAAVNEGPLLSCVLTVALLQNNHYHAAQHVLHLYLEQLTVFFTLCVCVCADTHTLRPNCLHRGGHAFACVRLSVYLTVSKITPNVINRFN